MHSPTRGNLADMALVTEAEMLGLRKKIAKADPAFKPILSRSPLCTIGRKRTRQSHYQTLVESILSQQLAVKAADTIIKRVSDLVGGDFAVEKMNALTLNQLRAAGASGAKAKSIFELTDATLAGDLHFSRYGRMSSDAISEELTAIWGIGRWTVEMFLMFHLGRLDVWPTGDLGVRRGWERIHSLKKEITPKELEKFSTTFEGYQSVVAWYCWRALEKED
ncbi:MAG: hypothetical protein RL414_890 [Actinomycetota bacterium]|jgi:DNA-3-methyladenine glycosylase II